MNAARSSVDVDLPACFCFEGLLLASNPLPERIAGCLDQCMDFLDRHTAPVAMQSLSRLFKLSDDQQRMLEISVVSIGHVGFLLPAGADEAKLRELAQAKGLTISSRAHSEIFARELGAMAGRDLIETHIYRMEGLSKHGHPVNIEVFVPEETSGEISA